MSQEQVLPESSVAEMAANQFIREWETYRDDPHRRAIYLLGLSTTGAIVILNGLFKSHKAQADALLYSLQNLPKEHRLHTQSQALLRKFNNWTKANPRIVPISQTVRKE